MMFSTHDGDDGVQVLSLHAGTMGAPLFVIVDNLLFGRLARAPSPRAADHRSRCCVLDPTAAAELLTLEGMATKLVRCIRRAQASGPYRLAGFYDTGVLAYEVAVQIYTADELVEIVALGESECLGWREWRAR
jgi:hypothetical protein